MKKISAILLCLLLTLSSASATILPAAGVDEDFYNFTGIECTPAVVLCQSLSILDARGDQGGKKVTSLRYSGGTIPVIQSWDGYAEIYYSDGNKTGWVRNEYLLMDPAWYLCDDDVQVYAYPDSMAPRVALIDKDTVLPIITEVEAENQEWVCVSLWGAAGWIRKTPKDTADDTWFRPEMLKGMTRAVLTMGGESVALTSQADLDALTALLTSVNDMGGEVAGCPFVAALTLFNTNGGTITLALATDSCCVYRLDGRDYQYARYLRTEDNGVDNNVLFELFGLTTGR